MVKITKEAKEDLKQFEENIREELLDYMENCLVGNRNSEKIGFVSKPEFGVEFQRLKLKSNSLDHRVYFDYLESEIVVFAVRHRDYAYSNKDLKEIEGRLDIF